MIEAVQGLNPEMRVRISKRLFYHTMKEVCKYFVGLAEEAPENAVGLRTERDGYNTVMRLTFPNNEYVTILSGTLETDDYATYSFCPVGFLQLWFFFVSTDMPEGREWTARLMRELLAEYQGQISHTGGGYPHPRLVPFVDSEPS
jgi:hypothetical protein